MQLGFLFLLKSKSQLSQLSRVDFFALLIRKKRKEKETTDFNARFVNVLLFTDILSHCSIGRPRGW